MTTRLYYDNSKLTDFSARVVEHLTWDGHPAVILDRTAFYPTSGGQPADRGMLDSVPVLDVAVRDTDQAVVHVLAAPLPRPVGEEVTGAVDWPRRFDHMQQHSGQHLLSAAFERLLKGHTVGFHLGDAVVTVDIALPNLTPADVAPVEELVNRVIWEDRPVTTRFVTDEELAALPLRRQPAVRGPIRIVHIADFDLTPCGGTHVSRTGEIGLLKILRLDHRGETTRIEFICGGRALEDYRRKHAVLARLGTMLSVGWWELPEAVERLLAEGKQLRLDLRRNRQRLLAAEAEELAAAAVAADGHRVVWRVFHRRTMDELRRLAKELIARPGLVVMLAGVGDERTNLCFARSADVERDMAALMRRVCEALGGKGGGRPDFAQGSAPTTDQGLVGVALSMHRTAA